MTTNSTTVQAINDLLPGAIPHSFARILDLCEIAGAIIERFEHKYGSGRRISSDLFMSLRPSLVFADGCADRIYEHHVTELLERALVGGDLSIGTKAEALLCMRVTSLATPLNRDGEALYHMLFHECMGPDAYIECMGEPFDPDRLHRGGDRIDEILAYAQRKTKLNRPKHVELWKPTAEQTSLFEE